jgi:uncharacterized protein RhaS with RHS repeats
MFYDARYYDPPLGRFVSEDPIGFTALDTNLYRYTANNPINYVDPMGLEGDIPYWEDDDWWCDSWDDWLNPFAYVRALCDPLDREIDLQRKERGMILGKVMDIESLEKYNSTHKAGEATSTAIKSLAVTDAVFIELATCLATGARYVGMPKATSKPFHERGKLIGKFNKFHTEAERAWAHEMVAKGKTVKIVSNVQERAKAGLKSLDFIVDGVTYEVKHLHSTGKSTLKMP